jgi:hypothetical protein
MPRFHQLTRGRTKQFTAEEETARDAEEKAWTDDQLNRDLKALRDKRNALLKETDWWGASDNTMTADQTKYRKDLRDLPSGLDTVEKVANVTWPTKP